MPVIRMLNIQHAALTLILTFNPLQNVRPLNRSLHWYWWECEMCDLLHKWWLDRMNNSAAVCQCFYTHNMRNRCSQTTACRRSHYQYELKISRKPHLQHAVNYAVLWTKAPKVNFARSFRCYKTGFVLGSYNIYRCKNTFWLKILWNELSCQSQN